MVKKIVILLVLGVFFIGAFGGCYTSGIPDLSGNWRGKLYSAKLPGVNIEISINNLTQDSNGNFTGGTVIVTYSGNYNNTTLSGTLTASVYGGNTDEIRARIKARGNVDPEQTLFLVVLILATTGNYISLSSGDYYELAFTFPHMYGCVDGVIKNMTGDYQFTLYQAGALPGVFDEGTATIEKVITQD